MNHRKIHTLLFGLTLLAIIFFTASVLKPSAEHYWLYASGAVIPNGIRTHGFSDQPNIKLFSVEGERWMSQNKTALATAYYALVILPQVPLRENGSVNSCDGKSQTSTLKWLSENSSASSNRNTQEHDLTSTYDPIFQTVTIDSANYQLTKGNLFVIRLNEEWKPQVTQFDAIFRGDIFEAGEYFKRALPDEEGLQKVL